MSMQPKGPGKTPAEAVRARIDFKYALGLHLGEPGFDFSVLSEFRDRLAGADGGRRVLDVSPVPMMLASQHVKSEEHRIASAVIISIVPAFITLPLMINLTG